MTEYSGILTYGEVRAGKLAPVSFELLGIGRKLADTRGEELSMLLIDRQAGSCGATAWTCSTESSVEVSTYGNPVSIFRNCVLVT